MSAKTASMNSIKMLSLDGGTPEGAITQISLVQEIITRTSFDSGKDVDPGDLRPCDFFDIIGGTGLGGVQALLFGHLKLTCREARDKLEFLLKEVFVEPKEELATQSTFQWVTSAILGGGSSSSSSSIASEKLNTKMLEPTMKEIFPVEVPAKDDKGGCIAVVFVRSTFNLANCRAIAFQNGSALSLECTVAEAASATVSMPDLFPAVVFSDEREYITAGLGSINPTRELIRFAESFYKGERRVGCIANIGSGTRRAVKHSVKKGGEDAIVDEITRSIEDHIAVDALRTSEELKKRLTHANYFYLTVDSGLHDSKMTGWDLSHADQHADTYKERHDADRLIDECVGDLAEKSGGVTLKQLVQNTATGINAKTFTKPPQHYVEPIKDYNQMYEAVVRQEHSIAVVTGRLGCGKTLLSSYFAFREQRRYKNVFVIDCNTAGDIRGDLQTAIRSLGPAHRHATWEQAIAHFSTTTEPWLIIFDGVSEQVKIAEFIPHNKSKSCKVIINGRDKMLGSLAPGAHIQMESRSDRDAMKILEKAAHYDTALIGDAYTQAHRLCKAVGCVPVVLVQAGSYCRRMSSYEEGARQSFNFESYRKMYEMGRQRWELLGEKAPLGMDGYNDYFMKTLEADMERGKSISVM